jgi:hypothetical protein
MSSDRPSAAASAKPKFRVALRFHRQITPSASALMIASGIPETRRWANCFWSSSISRANRRCVRSVVRSIESYARDEAALGQQLLLRLQVDRDRVRRTRALMKEIPAACLRQLVLTRGKPSLGQTALMKIVRR